MSRILTVGGAQLGPIARNDSRQRVVARLIDLLRQAHAKGCKLAVFPELALTSFFPRWFMTDEAEIDSFFEREMPSAATRPLFAEAARLGIGFCLGYAELAHEGGRTRRFNTSILVDPAGRMAGKYRKIHLPGHAEYEPLRPFQHLEKRYFEPGDLGFPVWRSQGAVVGMCICNDRRWSETYRVMGLQGVELVLLGYNTPQINGSVLVRTGADEPAHLRMFHNHLVMQAGAYENSTFVVGVAKAGMEEGSELIGGSCIIAPSGEIVAIALSQADELIVADLDLELTVVGKETIFNFAKHRRIEHYGLIATQTGAVPPP
ncbi:MAG: N-carbamoyl-D-amino-acid hydrolase [Pseudomonadota bacterium]